MLNGTAPLLPFFALGTRVWSKYIIGIALMTQTQSYRALLAVKLKLRALSTY